MTKSEFGSLLSYLKNRPEEAQRLRKRFASTGNEKRLPECRRTAILRHVFQKLRRDWIHFRLEDETRIEERAIPPWNFEKS